MHRTLCSVLLLGVTGVAWAAPAVVLTRDGQPAATIVLGALPSASAQFAAAELREHVRRISGATLPIVSEDQPVQGTSILVGESAATRKLGLPGQELQPQEYLLRALPDTLVLMGRDEASAETAQSTPGRQPGKHGNAGQFGGQRTFVTVASPGFSDEAGSLEAWVWMPAATAEKHGTILRLDGGDPWTYHILQRDGGTSRISYTTYDSKRGHGLGTPPLAEGWYHALAIWDAKAGKQSLYLDGKLVGTCEYVKTSCAGAVLGIGGIGTSPTAVVGNPFLGLIDEAYANLYRNGGRDLLAWQPPLRQRLPRPGPPARVDPALEYTGASQPHVFFS
jgi:hypothetical protein